MTNLDLQPNSQNVWSCSQIVKIQRIWELQESVMASSETRMMSSMRMHSIWLLKIRAHYLTGDKISMSNSVSSVGPSTGVDISERGAVYCNKC